MTEDNDSYKNVGDLLEDMLDQYKIRADELTIEDFLKTTYKKGATK